MTARVLTPDQQAKVDFLRGRGINTSNELHRKQWEWHKSIHFSSCKYLIADAFTEEQKKDLRADLFLDWLGFNLIED